MPARRGGRTHNFGLVVRIWKLVRFLFMQVLGELDIGVNLQVEGLNQHLNVQQERRAGEN